MSKKLLFQMRRGSHTLMLIAPEGSGERAAKIVEGWARDPAGPFNYEEDPLPDEVIGRIEKFVGNFFGRENG